MVSRIKRTHTTQKILLITILILTCFHYYVHCQFICRNSLWNESLQLHEDLLRSIAFCVGSLYWIWFKWDFNKRHCFALPIVLLKAFQFLKLNKKGLYKMVGEGGGYLTPLAGYRTPNSLYDKKLRLLPFLFSRMLRASSVAKRGNAIMECCVVRCSFELSDSYVHCTVQAERSNTAALSTACMETAVQPKPRSKLWQAAAVDLATQ